MVCYVQTLSLTMVQRFADSAVLSAFALIFDLAVAVLRQVRRS